LWNKNAVFLSIITMNVCGTYPPQLLIKGAWYAINLTKVSQTQTQMVGHVLHNKRENISIVDLVISPSDHI
jgi:hypothetical protein